MISKIALATALAMVIPAGAYAQSAPDQTQTPPAAAEPDTSADVVVTGRFVDTGAKSAMKMNVSVLDTPATVASYSQAFVKSLDTSTVSDLYNYMTGIKKSGNTGYDITLRGFKGSGDDRNTILVDGLPGLTGRYGSPPTVNIDHIELVKGPTSVLYGQNQPGGFINLITKKPLAHAEYSAEIRANTYAGRDRAFGDHNGIQGEFDATGPITLDGALLYRLDGSLQDVHGFRDGAHTTQQFISPSLTWHIGSSTSLTVQGEYRHVREHMDNGIVAPTDGVIYSVALADKRTASYQQPDDYRIETGKAVNAFLTHDFGTDWHFNASYRHVTYSSNQKSFDQTGFITIQGQNEVQRRARALATARRYDYLDTNIQGKFNTGTIEHHLLVGFNIGSNDTEENRSKFYNSSVRNTTTGVCPAGGTCLEIPIYNPSAFYGNYPTFDSLPSLNPQLTGQASLLTDKITKAHNYGIYVSDLITFLPWLKVSLAGRKFGETSSVEGDRRNAPGVIARRTDSKSFLPSAGILIEPSRHLTIYTSYSESFVPADPSAIDGNGNVGTLHPITAKQYEAGVKAENIFDRKLSFTAALYRIDQDGQVTQNPCAFGTCSYQTGKGRSDGFEVQGEASPIDHLQILFGYSHIVAKILTAPGLTFQVGDALPNVARDAVNVWSRYSFSNGFAIGTGLVYTGPRQGLLPTAATDVKLMPLPGYTIADVGIYYDQPHYSINLKVGNLFDARYFESAGATGRIQLAPGSPRNLTLSFRVKF